MDWQPVTSDGLTARWLDADDEPAIDLALQWDNEAWTATVHIAAHRADVVYRLSPLWQIRQVILFRDLQEPDLWLGTDGQGRWGEVNGVHRPELSGAHDLAIAGGVFHHMIPIRRKQWEQGESAQLNVLTLDVETLGVVAAPATYTRLDQHRWHVTDGETALEFDVDEFALPLNVGDLRRAD